MDRPILIHTPSPTVDFHHQFPDGRAHIGHRVERTSLPETLWEVTGGLPGKSGTKLYRDKAHAQNTRRTLVRLAQILASGRDPQVIHRILTQFAQEDASKAGLPQGSLDHLVEKSRDRNPERFYNRYLSHRSEMLEEHPSPWLHNPDLSTHLDVNHPTMEQIHRFTPDSLQVRAVANHQVPQTSQIIHNPSDNGEYHLYHPPAPQGVVVKAIVGQPNSARTQRGRITRNTYAKFAKDLAVSVKPGHTVLDYGAGDGLGNDELHTHLPNTTIHSYEPFPEAWEGSTPVTFRKPEDVTQQYDHVVSMNVLNVLEPELRHHVTKHLLSLIKPGGRGFVGARGWSGDVGATKNFTPHEEDHSLWVNNSDGTKTFHHGFSSPELATYLQEVAGPEYVVNPSGKYTKAGAIIKRLPPTNPELQKAFTDNNVAGRLPKRSLEKGYVESLRRAESQTNTNPTDAQKEAENYAKGKFQWKGLTITIENPKGSIRRGKNPKFPWEVTMGCAYGYFNSQPLGKDGDPVDVFVCDSNLDSDIVFVINQADQSGKFDEEKIIIGCVSEKQARSAYLSCYSKGWMVGEIYPMTIDDFKVWLSHPNRKRFK